MADRKTDVGEILNKNEDNMTDIERMMAEIMLSKQEEESSPDPRELLDEMLDSKEPLEPVVSRGVVPPARKVRTRNVQKESFDIDDLKPNRNENGLPERTPVNASTRTGASETQKEEQKLNKTKAKSNARKTNIEREKKLAKDVKRKNGKPAAVILMLCAIMLIGAFVFHKMMENIYGEGRTGVEELSADNYVYDPEETDNPAYFIEIPPDTVFPSPEPEVSPEDEAPAEEEEEDAGVSIIGTPEKAKEENYTIYVEDLSWTEAQEKCLSMGGHLATISNQDELDTIISMAEEQGIEKLWIGCHRENGQLVWENYEHIDFYKWGKGEPSEYDSGDNVAEDYLLLWKFNGEWVYNDSRNDPVADYPNMYSGKIGYVFESF